MALDWPCDFTAPRWKLVNILGPHCSRERHTLLTKPSIGKLLPFQLHQKLPRMLSMTCCVASTGMSGLFLLIKSAKSCIQASSCGLDQSGPRKQDTEAISTAKHKLLQHQPELK